MLACAEYWVNPTSVPACHKLQSPVCVFVHSDLAGYLCLLYHLGFLYSHGISVFAIPTYRLSGIGMFLLPSPSLCCSELSNLQLQWDLWGVVTTRPCTESHRVLSIFSSIKMISRSPVYLCETLGDTSVSECQHYGGAQ